MDDHLLFADVVGAALEARGITIVGVAAGGTVAIEIARREHPDVALVDLALAGESGVTVGQRLLEVSPETKVIALTALTDSRAVADALRNGFHGYMTKDRPLGQLVPLLNAVAEGETVVPQRLATAAAGVPSCQERQARVLADQLSPRERDVLSLLAAGVATGQIARTLAVSPNTVRSHVQSILTKLQVHSRLGAVAFAVRYGLVEASEWAVASS